MNSLFEKAYRLGFLQQPKSATEKMQNISNSKHFKFMPRVSAGAPHASSWCNLSAFWDHFITPRKATRRNVWSELYKTHGGKPNCCSLWSPKNVNVIDIFLMDASQLPVKEHMNSLRNSLQELEL